MKEWVVGFEFDDAADGNGVWTVEAETAYDAVAFVLNDMIEDEEYLYRISVMDDDGSEVELINTPGDGHWTVYRDNEKEDDLILV